MHSRTYSYDSPDYSGGQAPLNPDGTQYSTTPPYQRGYNHQPGSGHYYVQPPGQPSDVGIQSNPYYRSMTPTAGQRYSTSGDDRYYQATGAVASSSHVSPPVYSPQTPYYPSQYPPSREHRSRRSGGPSHTPETHFIPTPSEMVQGYNNYPPRQITVPPQSPTLSPEVPYPGSQYPPPHSIVPSSRVASQRTTHTSSGRPQTAPTGASPTSASSPSGERFPCEMCGKTFSRSHDRKRHHETQHLSSPVVHRCRFCEKEFSRADSLKRHLDNGCDEMPT